MIDPRIKHVGVSKMRDMTAAFLAQMEHEGLMYVLQEGDQPLAVILGYKAFMSMQERLSQAQRDLAELLEAER